MLRRDTLQPLTAEEIAHLREAYRAAETAQDVVKREAREALERVWGAERVLKAAQAAGLAAARKSDASQKEVERLSATLLAHDALPEERYDAYRTYETFAVCQHISNERVHWEHWIERAIHLKGVLAGRVAKLYPEERQEVILATLAGEIKAWFARERRNAEREWNEKLPDARIDWREVAEEVLTSANENQAVRERRLQCAA